MSLTGTIFNIQRFSIKDGPGIRTTVFLKGCPLSCAWCHNPEGISARPQLMWYDTRCIGSRDCISACPQNALNLTPAGMQIDRVACDTCGVCPVVCPAGALEIIGRNLTPEEAFREVERDIVFYDTSSGGVTFSGGEPMAQAEFVWATASLCQQAGIHVALDTCGAAAWEEYERVLETVDLVLYDLKIMDPELHRASTGVDNTNILENARRISRTGTPMWIRTPVIPGYTAGLENIEALGDLIATELPTVERWELLAYTNLGQPKYHRLDKTYALEGVPLVTKSEMEAIHSVAIRRAEMAVWSGVTRVQDTEAD